LPFQGGRGGKKVCCLGGKEIALKKGKVVSLFIGRRRKKKKHLSTFKRKGKEGEEKDGPHVLYRTGRREKEGEKKTDIFYICKMQGNRGKKGEMSKKGWVAGLFALPDEKGRRRKKAGLHGEREEEKGNRAKEKGKV